MRDPSHFRHEQVSGPRLVLAQDVKGNEICRTNTTQRPDTPTSITQCNTVTRYIKIHHRTKAKTPQSPATAERRPAATGSLEAAPGNAAGLEDEPVPAPFDMDGEVVLVLAYLEPAAAPEGEAEPAPEAMPGIEEAGVPAPASDPPGAGLEPGADEPVSDDPEPLPGAAEEPGALAPAGEPPGAAAESGLVEPGVPAAGAEELPEPVPGAAVPSVAAGIGVVSVAVTGVPPVPHVWQTATVVVMPGPTPPAAAS